MSELVWFITKRDNGTVEPDPVGSATVLGRVKGEMVAQFRKRVKEEMSPVLDYCAANQLKVRVLDGGRERVLKRASEPIPPDCGLDEDHPLIVIAPPLPPPAAAPPAAAANVPSECAPLRSSFHRDGPLARR